MSDKFICVTCQQPICSTESWQALSDGRQHGLPHECVAALKKVLAQVLDVTGGRFREDGELVFSSAGYAAWTKRKGGERTQEILAENEALKQRLAELQQLCESLSFDLALANRPE